MSVVPFIEGDRILEIGHGPGHLQRILLLRGLFAVGIDESAQMGRLAKRNRARGPVPFSPPHEQILSSSNTHPDPSRLSDASRQLAYTQINLTRGLAQRLPFRNQSFDTIVATFPAEYIFDPDTLAEAQRILAPGGRLVILPGAIITGRGLLERLMAWIYRITGETPPNLSEILHERSKKPFSQAGFDLEVHEIDVRSSLVFILLATKPAR